MNADRQTGVALVSVLLVVAIATVMAVSMIQEQRTSIRMTQSFLVRGQASQYALGGEELARQILHEDFAEGTARDHLGEVWANPELYYEFEDGEINLQITDLQGLINLNGLSESNSRMSLARARLNNFFVAIGVDPSFVDRLQDWVDNDNSNRPTGAEDFDYLVFEPPYRAANTVMTDVSEVMLTGLPIENYAQMQSYVTVLPEVSAPLNINTAPSFVLQALAPGLSIDAADALVLTRNGEEGFESVDAFLQSPELAGLGIAGDGLSVQSTFFEVRVIARFQDRFSYLTSVVHRHPITGVMKVIKRDFSRSIRPVVSSESASSDEA